MGFNMSRTLTNGEILDISGFLWWKLMTMMVMIRETVHITIKKAKYIPKIRFLIVIYYFF